LDKIFLKEEEEEEEEVDFYPKFSFY